MNNVTNVAHGERGRGSADQPLKEKRMLFIYLGFEREAFGERDNDILDAISSSPVVPILISSILGNFAQMLMADNTYM